MGIKKPTLCGTDIVVPQDNDKLMEELGEGPTTSKPAQVQFQPDEIVATAIQNEAEGRVLSAAAKKKKKKNQKKKAAATEVTQEVTNNRTKDKKVPKHVREIQEKLTRIKESEEKKKREEEEKLRKEEEERNRLEELERLEEERKRAKKEREREKILRKKQEGKLLTGKQKEEARRRERMRDQILRNTGGLPLPDGDASGVPIKRPKYGAKKSKEHNCQTIDVASTSVVESAEAKEKKCYGEAEMDFKELDNVEEIDALRVDEKAENGVEEDDDEGEWDAKCWDDADLNLSEKSAFAEQKPEFENENLKKVADLKNVVDVESECQLENEAEKKDKCNDLMLKEGASTPIPVSTVSESNLRSPICCIMGHVDTGKTKLLDCIRGTNVQKGEAGGITQQIGATYIPAENIRDRTRADAELNVPGLLVIDTPGHESFTNLRSRGSGLCDIAVLVVDIMHGLEPQTIESLNLLKMRNTEFVVALNKVDRLYGWKTCKNSPILKAVKQQTKDVRNEFDMRITEVKTRFQEQGFNTELYYKNKNEGETISIIPTSAISGEGVPDLLLWLIQWTQTTMVEKLTFSNEVQCNVLEVKVVEGHGTTIDVVLVNGVLHEGDQIVVCGMKVPIVTTIRALLTPHPMKELRVKGTYLHHKAIKAAQVIKITAQGLEDAVAGTDLYVVGPGDDIESIKERAMEDMNSVLNRINKSDVGVRVHASTLGSLEALVELLKTPNIPISGFSIGPVHKRDVSNASIMLKKKKEYATILAFDVKVTPDANGLADEVGVRIFTSDTIYRLVDQFKAYIDNIKEEKKKEVAEEAVFPCCLEIIPDKVFRKNGPIILGVKVLEGIAKVGTPICIPKKKFIDLGQISSIEKNSIVQNYAKKGDKVSIKIVDPISKENQKEFGRHFNEDDVLVSHITRRSIDILETHYRGDLSEDEWELLMKLKRDFLKYYKLL